MGHSYSAPDVRETLSQLRYLRETDEGNYALTDSPAPVPPGALLAILLIYRDRFQPGASGLEVPTICTADHSPGRLLHLGEARVRALLNALHEAGRLTIEAGANLDQVRFHPSAGSGQCPGDGLGLMMAQSRFLGKWRRFVLSLTQH